jgi:hypothetical protein
VIKNLKKKDFEIYLIYKSFEKEKLLIDSVKIDLTPVESESKLRLELVETVESSYNFLDIGWIVVDIHIHEDIVVNRKIFEVEFTRFYQEYQRYNGEFSTFILEFTVKNFEFKQDIHMDSLESLIRILKLDSLIK